MLGSKLRKPSSKKNPSHFNLTNEGIINASVVFLSAAISTWFLLLKVIYPLFRLVNFMHYLVEENRQQRGFGEQAENVQNDDQVNDAVAIPKIEVPALAKTEEIFLSTTSSIPFFDAISEKGYAALTIFAKTHLRDSDRPYNKKIIRALNRLRLKQKINIVQAFNLVMLQQEASTRSLTIAGSIIGYSGLVIGLLTCFSSICLLEWFHIQNPDTIKWIEHVEPLGTRIIAHLMSYLNIEPTGKYKEVLELAKQQKKYYTDNPHHPIKYDLSFGLGLAGIMVSIQVGALLDGAAREREREITTSIKSSDLPTISAALEIAPARLRGGFLNELIHEKMIDGSFRLLLIVVKFSDETNIAKLRKQLTKDDTFARSLLPEQEDLERVLNYFSVFKVYSAICLLRESSPRCNADLLNNHRSTIQNLASLDARKNTRLFFQASRQEGNIIGSLPAEMQEKIISSNDDLSHMNETEKCDYFFENFGFHQDSVRPEMI